MVQGVKDVGFPSGNCTGLFAARDRSTINLSQPESFLCSGVKDKNNVTKMPIYDLTNCYCILLVYMHVIKIITGVISYTSSIVIPRLLIYIII